jgi:uncharacterized protein (TIGR00299 family) protein
LKTLHFDCFSGISGDMTVAALVDAGADREAVLGAVGSLDLPVHVEFQAVRRGGMAATYFKVEVGHEHAHRHLHHIEKILSAGKLSAPQLELALRVFRRLGEAEAKVHGIPIEKVHFHEVGAADSIVDIAGAAVALDSLGTSRVTARSVVTGSGTVQCDHGLMPVPAPATAELLRGVPLESSPIKAELTTPTGAAILATVVQEWTDSPSMTIGRIGCGAGTKEFKEQPNVLRVFVGESAGANAETADRVWVVETNLDDVSPEVVGYCQERLFAAGALDAYVIPMLMKKGRPGMMLGVIAPLEKLAAVEAVLFRETGTLGVRRHAAERSKLTREAVTMESPWGPLRAKRSSRDGHQCVTPEYDDCARIAREHGVSLREVFQFVAKAH